MDYSPALTFPYWLSELSLFEILQVQWGNCKHTKKGGRADALDSVFCVLQLWDLVLARWSLSGNEVTTRLFPSENCVVGIQASVIINKGHRLLIWNLGVEHEVCFTSGVCLVFVGFFPSWTQLYLYLINLHNLKRLQMDKALFWPCWKSFVNKENFRAQRNNIT